MKITKHYFCEKVEEEQLLLELTKLNNPRLALFMAPKADKQQATTVDEEPGIKECKEVKELVDEKEKEEVPLVVESVKTMDEPEKECHERRRKSVHSIFSPQHGVSSKDSNVNELFDLDTEDMLCDDMVHADSFVIPRDAEEQERTAHVQFTYNHEFLFKEEKEDSARETLHLVEKLRMQMSKTSNSSQIDLEPTSTVEDEVKKVDKPGSNKVRTIRD